MKVLGIRGETGGPCVACGSSHASFRHIDPIVADSAQVCLCDNCAGVRDEMRKRLRSGEAEYWLANMVERQAQKLRDVETAYRVLAMRLEEKADEGT